MKITKNDIESLENFVSWAEDKWNLYLSKETECFGKVSLFVNHAKRAKIRHSGMSLYFTNVQDALYNFDRMI